MKTKYINILYREEKALFWHRSTEILSLSILKFTYIS